MVIHAIYYLLKGSRSICVSCFTEMLLKNSKMHKLCPSQSICSPRRLAHKRGHLTEKVISNRVVCSIFASQPLSTGLLFSYSHSLSSSCWKTLATTRLDSTQSATTLLAKFKLTVTHFTATSCGLQTSLFSARMAKNPGKNIRIHYFRTTILTCCIMN